VNAMMVMSKLPEGIVRKRTDKRVLIWEESMRPLRSVMRKQDSFASKVHVAVMMHQTCTRMDGDSAPDRWV
jgi:hypothetical protein